MVCDLKNIIFWAFTWKAIKELSAGIEMSCVLTLGVITWVCVASVKPY